MKKGQHIPISDEYIRKGVDYKKVRMKMTLRIIDNRLGRNISDQEKKQLTLTARIDITFFKSYNDSNKKLW